MKFFSKLVEALSEDSIPAQLKKVRESNARLEESNARLEKTNTSILTAIANLPDQLQEKVNGEIKRVHDERMVREILELRTSLMEEIDLVRPITYAPYDSPRNGE